MALVTVHEFDITPSGITGHVVWMHTERLDKAGSTTSIVCAIHCALSPLVLPLLPLTIGHLVGPTLEWAFVATSLVLGTASLSHSYRVVHRDWRAIGLFISGFAVLMTVRVLEPPGAFEPIGVFGAAALIVSAHALNFRLGRRLSGGACGCACHDDGALSEVQLAHKENLVVPDRLERNNVAGRA